MSNDILDLHIEIEEASTGLSIGDYVRATETLFEELIGPDGLPNLDVKPYKVANVGDLGEIQDLVSGFAPAVLFFRTGICLTVHPEEVVKLNYEQIKISLRDEVRMHWQAKQEMAHLAGAMKDMYVLGATEERSRQAKKGGN